MKINTVQDNSNFKARVEIVQPQNLIRVLDQYPNLTIRARMIQEMCDTITLANTAAPLVGEEKDVIKLDFGKIKKSLTDEWVNVQYNNEDVGFLAVDENPLATFADIIEKLTDGIITRANSRKPFHALGSFYAINNNTQVQRIHFNDEGKLKEVSREITTAEALTEKLKKLLGLN